MVERAALLVALLTACSTPAATPYDGGAWRDAADTEIESPDPDPVLTPAEREALATLRYDDGPPPPDPSNRVADDPAARLFGQRLFFDGALSGPLLEHDNDGSPAALGHQGETGRVSCAGCHLPDSHFVDTRSLHQQVSLAAQWTRRRTPTLLEIAFAPLYNWDGRRDSIWTQAIGVMESDREMNAGRLFVAQQIHRLHREEYESIFGAPMPPLDDASLYPQIAAADAGCVPQVDGSSICRGIPGDGADFDGLTPEQQDAVTTVVVNAAKAIEAYVRLLRCGEAPFDRWLDGDATAIDRSAQRGAALFVGRGGCIACHSGPRLTDGEFHVVGLTPALVADVIIDDRDVGAAEGIAAAITDPLNSAGAFSDGDRGALPRVVTPEMTGAFRTPTLRCIAEQPSFMHTGQLQSLEDVVRFFDLGGHPPGGYPGVNELHPLGLSPRERADLVAFLRALQGPGADPTLRQSP